MSLGNPNSVQDRAAEALRTIGILFEPGDVIELRALHVGRTPDRSGSTKAGYFEFENSSAIADAVLQVDGRAEGVYVVLNRLDTRLLSRAKNRLQVNLKNTTTDADIVERRWLYIDFDPKRPAGISSTDAEHEAAHERALTVRKFLSALGWPEPVYADSGNGAHLLYRLPQIELQRADDLVKRCLKALSVRFSDDIVKVDEATSNASRICKLYGTLTRKGDNVPDRPHRRARIVEDPETLQPINIEALEAIPDEIARQTAVHPGVTGQHASGFDIDGCIAGAGLRVVKGPEAYKDGCRWILETCPFNTQHTRPAIIQSSNGAFSYSCLHNSCREKDWRAFKDAAFVGLPLGNRAAPGPGDRAAERLITDVSQVPSVWTFESDLEWCVPDMIARGSVTIICAESGTGKTWLAYYLAGCVAQGTPFLGHAVQPAKVLYLDGENPLYVVKQRLFDLGIRKTADLTIWGGWLAERPAAPSSPVVVNFANAYRPLIIYDSLIEFNPGSEQSSTETRAFMRQLRNLANLGATVVILHHTGKAETAKLYRGSSDIKAAVDTAYLLERPDSQSDEIGKLLLTSFKSRLAPGRNFAMEFRKGKGFCYTEAGTKNVSHAITEVLAAHPGMKQGDIVQWCQAAGCARRQVEAALKNGPWRKESGPKNAVLYSLPIEQTEHVRGDL